MYGSDQSASLEMQGMVKLTSSIEKMYLSIGEEKLGNISKREKIADKFRAHKKKIFIYVKKQN